MALGLLKIFSILMCLCSTRFYVQSAGLCSQFTGWKDYNASWYSRYPSLSGRMYPFGTDYCDQNATVDQRSSGLNPRINFTIPYYGSKYGTALISSHGYVTFNESSMTSQSVPFSYVDVTWPNPAYTPHSSAIDPPFIAPFYAELDYRIGYQSEPSQMSWRVLDPGVNPNSPLGQISVGMLDEMSRDVREAVIGAEWFIARWGLVVTWYNVTYSGAINCSIQGSSQYCPRNTFQLALVTDGLSTYTIFNYLSITWVGGAYQQKCDPATGTNTPNYPSCSPAQVGFNAGFGRGFTALPSSGLPSVQYLDTISGTDVPGRWIYSVAGDKVNHGGCFNYNPGVWPTQPPTAYPTGTLFSTPTTSNPRSSSFSSSLPHQSSTSQSPRPSSSSFHSTPTTRTPSPSPPSNTTFPPLKDGYQAYHSNWTSLTNESIFSLLENFTSRWPLVVWPSYGPMLGGQVIQLSGPCFNPSQLIVCRFDAITTRGYFLGSSMKAVCIQPSLNVVGLIILSVSLDGGLTYMHHAAFTSLPQERVPQLSVTVDNPSGDWLNPSQINLAWSPSSLNETYNDLITVTLLGYHDNDWVELYKFTSDLTNSGSYSLRPEASACLSVNDPVICARYNIGAFRVSLENSIWEVSNPRALYSAFIPLAWFTTPAIVKAEGWDWAHRRCEAWYKMDGQTTNWAEGLPACPCHIWQAYVDFGSFQPSQDCNMENTGQIGRCPFNNGAAACYQSTVLTSMGASSRCCYAPDGSLMYSGDGMNGSRSERSSPWGDRPFNVPTASHLSQDLIPYLQCCVWQVNNVYDCYNQYLRLRPTVDCKFYKSPGNALVYGDPHIVTFDGTTYTFGGWGEFWLVRGNQSDNVTHARIGPSFSLMGRFEQPSNQSAGNQTKSTILTAVAMRLEDGFIVSVIINPIGESDEKLLIYCEDILMNFSNPNLQWQQYKDMILIDNNPLNPYRNFTIILQQAGIGVNVAWNNGLMSLRLSLPGLYWGHTQGLFGTWNGNSADDLIPRNTTNGIAVDPSQDQEVYRLFGNSWRVGEFESLFTRLYRGGMSHSYYDNPWFIPQLGTDIPQNSSQTPERVSALCGSDNCCSYDLIVTGNETIALVTRAVGIWEQQRRTMAASVETCGWLPIPYSVRKYPVSYTVGSEVIITGCMDGYQQSGDTGVIYVCKSTGPQTVQWVPPVSFTCSYLYGQLPPATQAAIAVPVVVVCSMIIAALLAVFLVCQHKRKEKKQLKLQEQQQHQQQQQQQQQPLIQPTFSAPPPRQTAAVNSFKPVRVGMVPVQREEADIPLMENRPLSTGYVEPCSPPIRYSQVIAGTAPYIFNTSMNSSASALSIHTLENGTHVGNPEGSRLHGVDEVDEGPGRDSHTSPAPPTYEDVRTGSIPAVRPGAGSTTGSITAGAGLLGPYQPAMKLPYADSTASKNTSSATLSRDQRDSLV